MLDVKVRKKGGSLHSVLKGVLDGVKLLIHSTKRWRNLEGKRTY